MHRGVTVYKSTGGLGTTGWSEEEREVLYCRLEISSIKNAVTEIDPAAFIAVHALSDVHGGLVKKPIFH